MRRTSEAAECVGVGVEAVEVNGGGGARGCRWRHQSQRPRESGWGRLRAWGRPAPQCSRMLGCVQAWKAALSASSTFSSWRRVRGRAGARAAVSAREGPAERRWRARAGTRPAAENPAAAGVGQAAGRPAARPPRPLPVLRSLHERGPRTRGPAALTSSGTPSGPARRAAASRCLNAARSADEDGGLPPCSARQRSRACSSSTAVGGQGSGVGAFGVNAGPAAGGEQGVECGTGYCRRKAGTKEGESDPGSLRAEAVLARGPGGSLDAGHTGTQAGGTPPRRPRTVGHVLVVLVVKSCQVKRRREFEQRRPRARQAQVVDLQPGLGRRGRHGMEQGGSGGGGGAGLGRGWAQARVPELLAMTGGHSRRPRSLLRPQSAPQVGSIPPTCVSGLDSMTVCSGVLACGWGGGRRGRATRRSRGPSQRHKHRPAPPA
jgi:hypothetical protein